MHTNCICICQDWSHLANKQRYAITCHVNKELYCSTCAISVDIIIVNTNVCDQMKLRGINQPKTSHGPFSQKMFMLSIAINRAEHAEL